MGNGSLWCKGPLGTPENRTAGSEAWTIPCDSDRSEMRLSSPAASAAAADITRILDTAAHLAKVTDRAIKKLPTLRGRTVCNLFFEDSTRTRISFELAAKRLSADVINFTAKGSSVSKGESLKDAAITLEAMPEHATVMQPGPMNRGVRSPPMWPSRSSVPRGNVAGDGVALPRAETWPAGGAEQTSLFQAGVLDRVAVGVPPFDGVQQRRGLPGSELLQLGEQLVAAHAPFRSSRSVPGGDAVRA